MQHDDNIPLTHTFSDLLSLKHAYMEFVVDGAIFIPTQNDYALGDYIKVSLTLPENNNEYIFSGEVVWVSPKNTIHPGIGITCNGDEGRAFKKAALALIGELKIDEKAVFDTM